MISQPGFLLLYHTATTSPAVMNRGGNVTPTRLPEHFTELLLPATYQPDVAPERSLMLLARPGG